MMKFLGLFIDSVIMWIAAYIVGSILLEYKGKIKILKLIFIITIFSLLLALINIPDLVFLQGIVKIISVYTLQCLFYKITFKELLSKSMILSLIWYLCLFFSEVLLVLITSIITDLLNYSMLFIKNNIIMNILIALFTYLMVKV